MREGPPDSKDTGSETQKTRDALPSRTSRTGMRAMQGHTPGTTETSDAKSTRRVSTSDAKDTTSEPRTPDITSPYRLNADGQQAMQGYAPDSRGGLGLSVEYEHAARAGAAEHKDHYIKAQGRILERVALQEMTSREPPPIVVQDLNKCQPNFPVYDISNGDTVASVKCHLGKSAVDAYISDLELATGRMPGDSRFQNAAQELHKMARDGHPAVPSEMAASLKAAERYLWEHSELYIPKDQVKEVKGKIYRQLLPEGRVDNTAQIKQAVLASRLGLDPKSPSYEEDVKRLLERIKEVPINSDQVQAIMDDTFKRSS